MKLLAGRLVLEITFWIMNFKSWDRVLGLCCDVISNVYVKKLEARKKKLSSAEMTGPNKHFSHREQFKNAAA